MSHNFKYTEEHKKWVLDNSKNYFNVEEMRKDFNKTFNLQTTKSGFVTLRSRVGAKKPNFYTKEQDEFIKKMFEQGKTYKEIVELFNIKFNANKTINGLQQRVSDKRIFTNGGNDKRRRFLNQCPVGTIREHNDGRTITLLIKIKMIPEELIGKKNFYNKEYWIPYARYVYEKHYNCKLKDNEAVYHIDGDYRNNNIDNLVVNKLGAYGTAYGKVFKCNPSTKEEQKQKAKNIKLAFLIDCLNYKMTKIKTYNDN